jgi:diguanylate cyclase (GGDEF)-like protein
MPPALLDARVRTLVELRRLRGSTASLFHADGCRGIADRAAFDSMLKRESARLRRSDGYLGLLLISLDGLRDCRRTLGSAAGEGLIQRLAACAAQQVRRPPDLVARFDADRIACLLPETDLRGARVVAELIRGAIRTMDVPWDDTRVTVSIGVASRRCSGPEAALWLLTDAEERLIRAQRGGGDRLHTGDESIVMPRVQTSRGPARARPNL